MWHCFTMLAYCGRGTNTISLEAGDYAVVGLPLPVLCSADCFQIRPVSFRAVRSCRLLMLPVTNRFISEGGGNFFFPSRQY